MFMNNHPRMQIPHDALTKAFLSCFCEGNFEEEKAAALAASQANQNPNGQNPWVQNSRTNSISVGGGKEVNVYLWFFGSEGVL